MKKTAILVYKYILDMDFNDYAENIEHDLVYIEGLLKENGLYKTLEIIGK